MSQNTFEVVFSGKLVEGAAPAKVKANVAALFKVEVAKVERLFSGASVAIKKGLDEQTAKKYQLALHRAGAVCQVVNRAATKPATAPAAAAAKPRPAPATSRNTPVQLGLQKSVVKVPPQGLGEFAGVTVDAPGTPLVAHQEVAAPQLDISGLSMGEAGDSLVEEQSFEPLEVDVSTMSLDEPGATLVEHKEEPAPQIDTSKLSLE